MRNRFEDIEKFLENIVDKVKADNKDIEKMDIYNELSNYGLNDEERKSEGTLRKIQDKLYKDFRHKAFSDCWKSRDDYWLIFREESIDDMIRARTYHNREQIKMYIPAKEENMYEIANGLFDFLDKNYILNDTKMSADVRADDLVVRVFSQKDASSISKYINENFSDRTLSTNPFMINDGTVGIASDGKLSYNERVSGFLADYFSNLRNKGQLEDVNIKSFKEYMEKMRDEIYSDETIMKTFLQKKDKHFDDVSDLEYLCDNKNIMDFIIIALDTEKGIEDFNKHWEEINTSENKKSTRDNVREILNSKQKNNNNDEVEKNTKREEKIVTYDKNGFDRVGRHKVTKSLYDEEGYNRKGYDREGYDREGYNNEGFSKNGFDKKGKHKITKGYYDENGYDKEGYDKDGYNKEGVDKNNFNQKGININTGTKYDEQGYNKNGFNKDGIDRRDFNKKGINLWTGTKYDSQGYDKKGFDKNGFNIITYSRYDVQGFDKRRL